MEKCDKCGKDKKILFTTLYCDCDEGLEECWDFYDRGVVCESCGGHAFYMDANPIRLYVRIGSIVQHSSVEYSMEEFNSLGGIDCQYCKYRLPMSGSKPLLPLPHPKWLPRKTSK